MRKILFPGIIVVLIICLANCFADSKENGDMDVLFTPSLLVEAINNEADFVVDALCPDKDERTKDNIKSYIHLHYTEGSETMLWYDNEDWIIELSAYYENSKANAQGSAHSMTISYPAGEKYSFLYSTMGLAVSRIICSKEDTVDIYQLCRYIDNCYNDYMETGNGILGPLEFNGFNVVIMYRYQYDMDRCAISIIQTNPH